MSSKQVKPQDTEPINEKEKSDKQEDKGKEISEEALKILKGRHCTDIPCCLLFIAYFVGMLGIALYGFGEGDPNNLTYPYDMYGFQCGRSGDAAENYPYLYYPYPYELLDTFNLGYEYTTRICIQSCPENFGSSVIFFQKCDKCLSYPSPTLIPDNEYSDWLDKYLNGSVWFSYPTDKWLDRICAPTSDAISLLKDLNIFSNIDFNNVTTIISDIQVTWTAIIIMIFISLGLGIIFMILLKWFVGVIIWIFIFTFEALIIGMAGYCLHISDSKYPDDQPENKDTHDDLRIAAWILFGFAGLYALFILCSCNRIRLAVGVMKASAEFVAKNPTVLIVPPLMFILLCCWIIWWIFAEVFIYSIGDIKGQDCPSEKVESTEDCQEYEPIDNPVPEPDWDENTKRMVWFHFFGFLWMNAFIGAMSEFIICAAVVIWYFQNNDELSGKMHPIKNAVKWLFRYHLGTIAFGSFILALVQLVKYIITYMEKQAKKSGATNNRCVACLFKCLQCCVRCCERFIKYLNRQAYIQCAIQCKCFWKSAKEAICLMLRNPLTFATVHGLGNIILFLGKCVLAVATVFIGYGIITSSNTYSDQLYSPIAPCVIFLCIGYMIGVLFMSVWSQGCDSILQCFLTEREVFKVVRHAPDSLSSFITKVDAKSNPQAKGKCSCCGCC